MSETIRIGLAICASVLFTGFILSLYLWEIRDELRKLNKKGD